ncbi:MAG TPA: imidazolonepropionase [Tissierellia bacterium]|nr:imidazolonepropionase [Tissierellia bacterium]
MILKNIKQLVTFEGTTAIEGNDPDRAVILEDIDLRIEDGLITAIAKDLPEEGEVIDCSDFTLTPGYVDSHTHFIFGGNREDEYRMRLAGASYVEIMAAGGGIRNSVHHTRQASQEELVESGRKRLMGFLENGITTLESKSGYGLDLDTELKQLAAMEVLQAESPQTIVPTFMGAHDIPPEYENRPAEYLDYILETVMPRVKAQGIARYVDIFTEKGVFEIEESRDFLEKIKAMGYPIRLHADEIEPLDGAVLAGELKAVSADHLLKISPEGIASLKQAGTIAGLLPLTAFSLKAPYAPARDLLEAGVAVSLATDYNPGSCHSFSVPLLVALSTIYMRMNMLEVLCGLTINPAVSLGLGEEIGTIEVGKRADILLHRAPNINFLPYHFGVNTVELVIKDGVVRLDRRKSHVSGE